MIAPRCTSRAGFTLIEVIITLSIFCLLAGAVFGVFSATLQSASGLQDNQSDEDRVEALGAYLKDNLAQLPANGVVQVYNHREKDPAATGLIWGADEEWHALDPQLQANGYYALRVSTHVYDRSAHDVAGLVGTAPAQALILFGQQVQNGDPSLTWRPLLHDLKSVTWQFRQLGDVQWTPQITGQRPLLAEFIYQPATSSLPITTDFWLPPLQAATNPAALALPATANP